MRVYLISILIFIVLIGLGIFFIGRSSAPLQLLESSRKHILNAKKVNAHKLAPELFNEAQMGYDSAMLLWNFENGKFKFFRDYTMMEIHLYNSINSAKLSYTTAVDTEQHYWSKNQSKNQMLTDLLEHYKANYSHFPLNDNERKNLAKANLLLDEIQLILKNKSDQEIDSKFDECEKIISELINRCSITLKNYFKDYTIWEALQIEALKYSSLKKENVLIIDKLNRECQVYKNGKLLNSFPIELGANWIGDKEQAGDKTTPEGKYKVVQKKANSDTKYYKALLLDYPNIDDKKRHVANVKNGIISKNSTLGGDIEIHGNGGKGTDWTDGCIALSNEDMDKLYSIVTANTQVIIVGSSKPLEERLD